MHPSKNLNELTEEYLLSLKVRNLTESTIKGQRWKLGKFLHYLTGRGVGQADHVNKALLLDYQTELYHSPSQQGRPTSIAHQNNMLSAVRSFTGFLKERDYIVSDPARDIAYGKSPKRLPRSILTRSEARRNINSPDTSCTLGYRDKTIMEVLYTTGIRKEELNNLTLGDVDYHEGYLRIISGKGRKDRIVPLGRIACRYLENYIRSVRPSLIRDPYNHHLFLSSRGNKLSRNVVWEL
ncbi:MAG: tyrosine-type recombinase/integrase, partial [Deltaproteobacteria bacterium]|nr:tyrosine-type recombinase/integrase [Deltaproteobacteria bacterium]